MTVWRYLCGLTAAVLLAAGMCSCGSGEPDPIPADTETAPVSEETAPESEPAEELEASAPAPTEAEETPEPTTVLPPEDLPLPKNAVSSEPTEIPVTKNSSLTTFLPIVRITTEKPVSSRDAYVNGKMTVTCGDRVLYGLEEDGIQIKWRGNSSLAFEKKPYKIKLAKKTSLFGFSESRHWVLLACMFDRSLMRDKLALDFAADYSAFSPRSVWVEVFMNGSYIGTFQLCEQIRIEKDRLNIFNIEDQLEEDEISISEYTTENGYDITGGYLLELSVQYDEKSKFRTGKIGVPVMVKAPEDAADNEEMMQYLKKQLYQFENCITSSDMFSLTGDHYSRYFDFEDLAEYWVLSSLYKTHDFMINSTYFYKDAAVDGVEDKFHMGPVWDIGNSLGNFTALNGWKQPTEYDSWSSPSDNNGKNWYQELCRDPYFMVRCEEIFAGMVDDIQELVKDGGTIDQYTELLRPSVDANQLLYPSFGDGRLGLPENLTLDDEIGWIREFLSGRAEFMTRELGDLKTISLKFCNFSDDRIAMRLTDESGEELHLGTYQDRIGVSADYAADFGKPIYLEITGSIPSAVSAKVYVNDQKLNKYSLDGDPVRVCLDPQTMKDSHTSKNVVTVRQYDSKGILLGTNFLTLANQ